jgi:L-fucose isomerase-like protein
MIGHAMPAYEFPAISTRAPLEPQTAWLVASGDLRPLANAAGWSSQERLEKGVVAAFNRLGWSVRRAHEFDPAKGHGFIDSQRAGLRVFEGIPPEAPLIVAEGVWQYSHHVLPGLRTHRGLVLTVANFDGKWPGLVGLLGLNAGLTKMGREYSTIWSVDFSDDWFLARVEEWIKTGHVVHDQSHVSPFMQPTSGPEAELAAAIAGKLQADKAIIGVFDEGCMGMYNAIIDDELLNGLGIYKERLSQSALYAEMLKVTTDETDAVRGWLEQRGMTFVLGENHETDLTEEQLRQQCAMYIAALRISDDFGLDAVGIQYQQGLKDLVAASDLAEGLLNNVDRPPVTSRDGSRVLWDGQAFPNFNEVDEGVAADALVTNRVWSAMNLDPATTLHDVRWGEEYDGQFVWVFEISGSVPPSHFEHGYADAVSMRQSPVYFPAGGGTIRGVSKPGEIVWSRLYIADGVLNLDIGRGQAIRLPEEETERRWNATSPEWPMMHAVLDGVTRDQFMARHKANHVQVAYAPDAQTADRALQVKASVFANLGVRVHTCGTNGNASR